MASVLVTGGCGFIGSHLVDRLVNLGHSVRVLDSLEPQVHPSAPGYLNPSADYSVASILDEDALRKSLEGVEVAFHLASAVGVGQSMYQIDRYVKTNSYGTARFLQAILDSKRSVRRVVMASSMSVYGEGAYRCERCGPQAPFGRKQSDLKHGVWEPHCPKCGKPLLAVPTDERKPLHPMSVYATTKRDQEELCLEFGEAYGIPTVALRFFNVYGPRQSPSNPYTGVCSIFMTRLRAGQAPRVFEDGNQSRDFVYVSDAVEALVLAATRSQSDGHAINIGSGSRVTIADLAKLLIELSKTDVALCPSLEYRTGDVRHCFPDISLARTLLGFEPQVPLRLGLHELMASETSTNPARFEIPDAYGELKRAGLILR